MKDEIKAAEDVKGQKSLISDRHRTGEGQTDSKPLSITGSPLRVERILFLSYGYMTTGRLEPYRERLIQILAGVGCDVLAIKTNSFFQEYSHLERFPGAIESLLREIRDFDPDLIVSINRTGLCKEVLTETATIPVITLFQDPVYYATKELLQFNERDILCFIFPNPDHYHAELLPFALKRGALQTNLINVPFSLDTFTFFPFNQTRDLDVSFVGSSFGTNFSNLLIEMLPNTEVRHKIIQIFLAHRKSFISDIQKALVDVGVDFEKDTFLETLVAYPNSKLLQNIRNRSLTLQGIFDDQINAERRIHHLAALTDFQFEMYGLRDETWIEQMSIVNPELLQCYKFKPINDPSDLATLYNRSKIGFNISRVAAADKGFSFRVPELIACGTLLLTETFSRLPLSKVGLVDGEHFITYESPSDLRNKCAYYLSHEDERRSIVNASQLALQNLGPDATIHGGLAACMRRAGFAQLAERLDIITKKNIRLTSRVTLIGDFQGSILRSDADELPLIIDISLSRNQTDVLSPVNYNKIEAASNIQSAPDGSETDISNSGISTEAVLRARISDLEAENATILRSTSWQISAPLRIVKRLLNRIRELC